MSIRLCSVLALTAVLTAQTQKAPAAKPQESAVTIHVYKSGLFSGFAHNHVVLAPVGGASMDPQGLKAEVSFATKDMRVIDPGVSDKDRAEIQSTMLGPKVLDAQKFPEIRFKSSRIEQTSAQHYRVTGTLDLHGTRKELSFEVTGTPEHYHGATKLKQSDFGIQPISLFAGSVKVKDELNLEFDIYAPIPKK
ncbi:MAG TPA: YceI family protein [Candidatus Angelobacter sp.]|nr:YceI family protein [Candidatus Angelobacter sp.]